MEIFDICCCDSKHDECENDSHQSYKPQPRKTSGRGFIARIDLDHHDWYWESCKNAQWNGKNKGKKDLSQRMQPLCTKGMRGCICLLHT